MTRRASRHWWHRTGASRRRDVDWWHRTGASRRRDVDWWHRTGASRRRDVDSRALAAALTGLLALWLAASAHAQDSPPAQRHLGVQLRGFAGPVWLHAIQRIGDEQTTISGPGAAFELALGAMVGEELALNMDLVLAHSVAAEHGVLEDTAFTAIHLGVGVTYWVMPANVYLAASLGAARSSVDGKPVRIDIELPTSDPSRVGLGMHLALGKQWWLSRRFGLGATLSLLSSLANNPIGGENTDRIVLGAALALSATLH
jgi:hypothetical protein